MDSLAMNCNHFIYQVQQLTDEQIHHLVKMTRDFTVLFYKVRVLDHIGSKSI